MNNNHKIILQTRLILILMIKNWYIINLVPTPVDRVSKFAKDRAICGIRCTIREEINSHLIRMIYFLKKNSFRFLSITEVSLLIRQVTLIHGSIIFKLKQVDQCLHWDNHNLVIMMRRNQMIKDLVTLDLDKTYLPMTIIYNSHRWWDLWMTRFLLKYIHLVHQYRIEWIIGICGILYLQMVLLVCKSTRENKAIIWDQCHLMNPIGSKTL